MLDKLRARADSTVRTSGWASFLYSVFKKFGDDRAGQLAALVAYYGFFSLFPLLLVLMTVLGLVLRGNPEFRDAVLNSALSQFPIIGPEIRENLGSLSRSGVALAIGVGGALWAGLAGIKAMQNAMDRVWGVPFRAQPGFGVQLIRGLLMLVVLGAFVLGSTGLTGWGAGVSELHPAARALTFLASLVLNVVVFLLAFRILTVADVSWRDVLPGASLAAFVWTLLQAVGNYYLTNRLKQSSELFGFFGIVLGLLSWLYLASQVTLLAAEVNVVLKYRLWPRSLGPDPQTEADRRSLERYAKVEERSIRERVDVTFRPRRS